MKLEQAIAEFLLSNNADGLRRTTDSWYASILGRFERGVDCDLESITTNDMRRYLVGIQMEYKSESTIGGHKRALHRFWSWSAKEYRIPNPMDNIRYPRKPRPVPRAATLEDFEAMFRATRPDEMGTRDRAILLFLLDTGCRAAGLCGLKVNDLFFDAGRAIVTEKGGKPRQVYFGALTARHLQNWALVRQPSEWFFYGHCPNPLTPNGLRQITKRLAKKAGVKGRFNPHAIRHLFAQKYVWNTGDLSTLSRLMGHSSISTTSDYYLVFTENDLMRRHEEFSPVNNLNLKLDINTTDWR